MSFFVYTVQINSGQSDSNQLDIKEITKAHYPVRLTIISPGTLPETVNIQISIDGGATYSVLQSGGSDIVLPAGKATQLDIFFAERIKMVALSAVAADRIFQLGLGDQ